MADTPDTSIDERRVSFVAGLRALADHYESNDVRWGYCGACHDWTGEPEPAAAQLDLGGSSEAEGPA